ncbi:hypothetical protein EPZ47_28345 [Pseudomonas viciae]|uniref:Uncharacterized protein n=1 Tax=Pseudomonas viciae TaxID=2505979 RepID=A0A4P7PNU8_9PSED|nr:hypothetical protein EPZ47_28345 [Pseudomonas viciae]
MYAEPADGPYLHLGAKELLWRGSLLPLGCEAALKSATAVFQVDRFRIFGAAAQPGGSKLPRHNVGEHP